MAADDDKKHVRFLHSTPGFVNTDTPRTSFPSLKDGLIRWALVSKFQVVSGWTIRWFGISAKEAGQRHVYLLTIDRFVPGSWRVDRNTDIAENNETLKTYQERKWNEVHLGVHEQHLGEGVGQGCDFLNHSYTFVRYGNCHLEAKSSASKMGW